MELAGKTAWVTGSFSGIGLAVAEALAAKGAAVILHGLGDDALQTKLRRHFEDTYQTACVTDTTDLRDPAAIEQFCKNIGGSKNSQGNKNGIDILVNNAGIQHVAPLTEFDAAKWHDVIAVNLSAAFFTMKYTLPHMQQQAYGRVINIASVHGLVASVNKAAYVSAKHGLVGLTKVAALENAESGITVNAICPGWVETALIQSQYRHLAEREGIPVEQAKRKLVEEKQPSKAFIHPDRIGSLVTFLCSEAADGITGAALPVDGGWTAQ